MIVAAGRGRRRRTELLSTSCKRRRPAGGHYSAWQSSDTCPSLIAGRPGGLGAVTVPAAAAAAALWPAGAAGSELVVLEIGPQLHCASSDQVSGAFWFLGLSGPETESLFLCRDLVFMP
jgi:hypothetical protein